MAYGLKACSCHPLRKASSIRKILTTETAATIIHALITSRIDNGNSRLTGIFER